MRITNADIKLALEGAEALAAADLPFGTAMKVYDAIEALNPKARAIEAERIKLIQKHGEPTEDGGHQVKPEGEGWPAFQAAWVELMNGEQEVGALPEILVSELGDAEALKRLSAKAQLVGALRRIGVLVTDEPQRAALQAS